MLTDSTVGRHSIDCPSRQSIESRSSVDRLSFDIAVDAPRPNIGHMSVVYRSTVGDMSVNCRWHIGQLSVAYQLFVNLAGESNGFPFEQLSSVIMLLGKTLQCEAQLLYEVN